MTKPILVLLAALPLAACFSFGAKPPPTLMTLTSASAVPVGTAQSSASSPSILILVPSVPQALATARVPVQASDTSVAYLKDAQWVEPPQRLFARLLADTVTSRGRIVLSAEQSFSDPSARLTGELRNFGADAATSAAVVTFDAALIRTAGTAVEKRRFEARVPLAAITPAEVAVALNTAANQVAGEVADWVGR
ncbi:MAG: ABC-type transport auxiliary lipoprotein family protein [Pseudomonadota bacterium]